MTHRQIKYFAIHCTAGYGNIAAIERYWFETLGWKTGGYHRIIDLDGKVHKMYDFDKVTNGVLGHNQSSIHISYIGGVEPDNVYKSKDSRTAAQKEAILTCIEEAYLWCKQHQEVDAIKILGHRDFSPDKNGNGVIESWERIKDCPSFPAREEYAWIQGTKALNSRTIL